MSFTHVLITPLVGQGNTNPNLPSQAQDKMENNQPSVPLPTRRASTVLGFLRGVSARHTAEPLALLAADDFACSVVPSQPTPWRLTSPPLDKARFSQHLAGLFTVFASLRMSPTDMLEDDTSGRLVVRATTRGLLRTRLCGRRVWTSPSTLLVRLSLDGKLIEEIEEVADFDKLAELKRHEPDHFPLDLEEESGGGWVSRVMWAAGLVVGGTAIAVARFALLDELPFIYLPRDAV